MVWNSAGFEVLPQPRVCAILQQMQVDRIQEPESHGEAVLLDHFIQFIFIGFFPRGVLLIPGVGGFIVEQRDAESDDVLRPLIEYLTQLLLAEPGQGYVLQRDLNALVGKLVIHVGPRAIRYGRLNTG